jgi:hypothetical protein
MPKPNDFQLGVVELFSILLPGALLVAAILVAFGDGGRLGLPQPFVPFVKDPGVAWVAFTFAAYAAGHLIFMLASSLDDTFYDSHRKATWPLKGDHAYKAATALRRQALPGEGDIPMNTLSWAKATLLLRAPAAYSDVLRYEADSKFFRSLVVVLPIVGILLVFRNLVLAVPILSYLGYVCFFLYADRRYKSTEWAYRYVIVLSTVKPAMAPLKDPVRDDD